MCVALCIVVSAQIKPKDGPIATLNGIQFQGTVEEKGDAFRGIRYATAARFTPPVIAAYTENVDATQLGQVCPQGSCTNTGCSEDCLMLNIFTGKNATTNAVATGALLPVAIFVHGGSYNSGTGNIYPGTVSQRVLYVLHVYILYSLLTQTIICSFRRWPPR
jgi:carboxylesterase type B